MCQHALIKSVLNPSGLGDLSEGRCLTTSSISSVVKGSTKSSRPSSHLPPISWSSRPPVPLPPHPPSPALASDHSLQRMMRYVFLTWRVMRHALLLTWRSRNCSLFLLHIVEILHHYCCPAIWKDQLDYLLSVAAAKLTCWLRMLTSDWSCWLRIYLADQGKNSMVSRLD